MSNQSTREKEEYNAVAIRTAESLSEVRQALRKKLARIERPREKLFPRQNRSGLGVALEYERMGNRPVSEALQARAEEFGFEFEHLGVTVGSVIHGIDLAKKDVPCPCFLSRSYFPS